MLQYPKNTLNVSRALLGVAYERKCQAKACERNATADQGLNGRIPIPVDSNRRICGQFGKILFSGPELTFL